MFEAVFNGEEKTVYMSNVFTDDTIMQFKGKNHENGCQLLIFSSHGRAWPSPPLGASELLTLLGLKNLTDSRSFCWI